MNRRIETALRSKYNFRKQCSAKETNELCAQGYNNYLLLFSVNVLSECVCYDYAIEWDKKMQLCVVFKLSVERIVWNYTKYRKGI